VIFDGAVGKTTEHVRRGQVPGSYHPGLKRVIWAMRDALGKITGNRDTGKDSYRFNVLIRLPANADNTVRKDRAEMRNLGFDPNEGNPMQVQPTT
jgi:hypothetical protein